MTAEEAFEEGRAWAIENPGPPLTPQTAKNLRRTLGAD